MELDELKRVWGQYDKVLSKNLKINEELLRSINFEKINNALKKPMYLELLNILVQLLAIVLLTVISIRLSNEIHYLAGGLIAGLLSLVSIIFSLVKASQLKNICYYHRSIINFQKDFTRLNVLVSRLRRIEYPLAALLGVIMFPLLLKAFAGIDLIDNLSFFIVGVFCTLVIGFTVGTVLNVFFYDKGLKDAKMFLDLIQRFDEDE